MYKFYLEKVKVPTPGKLEIKVKGANKVIRLANDGEMNLIRQPGLTEFKFKVLLPMIGGEKSPDFYIKHLENLMTSGKPFRFIVNRTDGYTKEFFSENLKLVGNTAVTLESFEIVEDANNGSDVEVAIVLKKYVHYVTKEVALQIVEKPAQKKEPEPIVQTVQPPFRARYVGNDPTPPTQPIVSAGGDTVYNTAKKYGVSKQQVNVVKNTGRVGVTNGIAKDDKVYIDMGNEDPKKSSKYSRTNHPVVQWSQIEIKPTQKSTALGQAMKNLRKTGEYRGSR